MESGTDSCLAMGIVVAGTIKPDYERDVPF
jgi:hypothetical protein